jgi:uncharacterized protein YndB with AHSA1/START domain
MQDAVEREIVVRAPKERVYAALTEPDQLTAWWPRGGIEGTLRPGETPILDFGEYGKCAVHVVAAEPHRYFAFRWVQGATTPEMVVAAPLSQPNTLVEFHFEGVSGGTRVRVVESGLAALPAEAYERVIKGIPEGWGIILGALERHLAKGQ